MAYTVNLTNGTIFATVNDGNIDQTAGGLQGITLVGKNYAGYGEFFNENFVRLLENGSNSTAPSAPITGQLWFDTASGVLKVYNGSAFKNLGSASTDATQPTGAVVGDLWFDPVNSQLNVYDGTQWILVGPSFTAGTGITGAIADTVQDTVGGDHVVVKLFVEDDIVGIISKDAQFTPSTAISGFTNINPGIQLSTSISGQVPAFIGTASNSTALGTLLPGQFLRSDINDITTGTLNIQNDSGLRVGADNDGVLYVTGDDVRLANTTVNGDIIFAVNDGGVSTAGLRVDGATGGVYLMSTVSIVDNHQVTSKTYVDNAISSAISGGTAGVLFADGSIDVAGDLNPDTNNTRDLGSSTRKYAQIWATSFNGVASSAQYADLAERFAADEVMVPGTVVELGGAEEITVSEDELSDNVFGVISTAAAYLMNAGAGDDETHPAVAMNGRVPVRVIGEVRKGDRLVSAGNGIARAADASEITAFNVIGRALEDKLTEGEGVVEAIVSIN